jgi:hypothetical protein
MGIADLPLLYGNQYCAVFNTYRDMKTVDSRKQTINSNIMFLDIHHPVFI